MQRRLRSLAEKQQPQQREIEVMFTSAHGRVFKIKKWESDWSGGGDFYKEHGVSLEVTRGKHTAKFAVVEVKTQDCRYNNPPRMSDRFTVVVDEQRVYSATDGETRKGSEHEALVNNKLIELLSDLQAQPQKEWMTEQVECDSPLRLV